MIMKRLLALALLGGFAAAPSVAGDHKVPPVTDPMVLKECGSCHMVFQPAFLPARSWDRMMDGLSDHFGDDASLPADEISHIRAILARNAGDAVGGRAGGKLLRGIAADQTPQRITATPYFLREHDFSGRRWANPKVLTKSNCPACHSGAAQGWYDDD